MRSPLRRRSTLSRPRLKNNEGKPGLPAPGALDSGARLEMLLEWMSRQDFATISAGEPSLLRQVEEVVIESHRRLYQAARRPWSKPIAYRWLRFEDAMPVERLREGVEKLRRRAASIDPDAVDKVCKEAVKHGFSY
jgi:hypothetical protein